MLIRRRDRMEWSILTEISYILIKKNFDTIEVEGEQGGYCLPSNKWVEQCDDLLSLLYSFDL